MVLYGHSHRYDERVIDGTLWLNPGSCGPRRFHQPITMAVMTIEGRAYQVEKLEFAMREAEEQYMSERPRLDRTLDGKTFRSYYYLKEELTAFCRENGLPVSGGKIEITERIACFLEYGRCAPGFCKDKEAGRMWERSARTGRLNLISCAVKSTGPFSGKLSAADFPLTWPFRNG